MYVCFVDDYTINACVVSDLLRSNLLYWYKHLLCCVLIMYFSIYMYTVALFLHCELLYDYSLMSEDLHVQTLVGGATTLSIATWQDANA